MRVSYWKACDGSFKKHHLVTGGQMPPLGYATAINRRRIVPSRLYALTFVRNRLRTFVVYFRADTIPTVQRPQCKSFWCVRRLLVSVLFKFLPHPNHDRVTTAYQTASEPFSSASTHTETIIQ